MGTKNQVLVSVIMPAYNAGRYLCACLDSVLQQSLRNIEVICVDDKSTDDSLAILQTYARLDQRIILLESSSNTNQGSGFARNRGLDIARGEYLSFLDADDVFNLDMLERAYCYAKTQDADIVMFDFNDITPNGKIDFDDRGKNSHPQNLNLAEQKITFNITNPSCWNKLYRRNLINRNKLRFQELTTCNDIGFSWTALACANRIFYLNQTLVHYRRHHSTNISSKRHRHATCIVRAAEYIKQFIQAYQGGELTLKIFYQNIVSCFAYEYRCFPVRSNPLTFLKQIIAFLPKRYHQNLYLVLYKHAASTAVWWRIAKILDSLDHWLRAIIPQK